MMGIDLTMRPLHKSHFLIFLPRSRRKRRESAEGIYRILRDNSGTLRLRGKKNSNMEKLSNSLNELNDQTILVLRN